MAKMATQSRDYVVAKVKDKVAMANLASVCVGTPYNKLKCTGSKYDSDTKSERLSMDSGLSLERKKF